MPKRKAGGPPETDVETTLTAPEIEPVADLNATVHGPIARSPTGDEHREGPSISHMSPVRNVPATKHVPYDNPFWELLALLGYETW